MPQSLAGYFGVDPAAQQMGRMGVPEIMEADAGQAGAGEHLLPSMGQATRLHRLPVFSCLNERGLGLPHANP